MVGNEFNFKEKKPEHKSFFVLIVSKLIIISLLYDGIGRVFILNIKIVKQDNNMRIARDFLL